MKTEGFILLTINDYLFEQKMISEKEKRMMERFISKKHGLSEG
jgi:transcriptional regulator CtsR